MSDFVNDGHPFLSRDAQAIGFNRTMQRRLIRQHRVRMVCRGVFVDAGVPDSRWLRVKSAKLVAPPHAVLSDEFAAWVYGVDVFRPGERHSLVPTFTVPHGTHRSVEAGVRYRHAILPASDVTYVDGLLVTTPLRTTSDLLRRLWRPYALAAADSIAHADLVTADEVWLYVDHLRGYQGVVQARELAMLIEPKAASPGESWQRLRLLDAGFPRPVPQFEVIDADWRSRWLDLAYPELLVAIEYDGREFHTSHFNLEHDATRRDYLRERYGWRFVVARRDDIFGNDPSFEQEVGGLIGVASRSRTW